MSKVQIARNGARRGMIVKSENTPVGGFSSPKRTTMLEQISEDMPSKVRLFEKCFLAQASPRVAIKAMCVWCTWGCHDAIRHCTADDCPVWEYRSYTRQGQESVQPGNSRAGTANQETEVNIGD